MEDLAPTSRAFDHEFESHVTAKDAARAVAQSDPHRTHVALLVHFLEAQTGMAWVGAEQPPGALRGPAEAVGERSARLPSCYNRLLARRSEQDGHEAALLGRGTVSAHPAGALGAVQGRPSLIRKSSRLAGP